MGGKLSWMSLKESENTLPNGLNMMMALTVFVQMKKVFFSMLLKVIGHLSKTLKGKQGVTRQEFIGKWFFICGNPSRVFFKDFPKPHIPQPKQPFRHREGKVLVKTNPEKYDLTEEQFAKAILESEQYLNDLIATKVYRKFHILIRFHL